MAGCMHKQSKDLPGAAHLQGQNFTYQFLSQKSTKYKQMWDTEGSRNKLQYWTCSNIWQFDL